MGDPDLAKGPTIWQLVQGFDSAELTNGSCVRLSGSEPTEEVSFLTRIYCGMSTTASLITIKLNGNKIHHLLLIVCKQQQINYYITQRQMAICHISSYSRWWTNRIPLNTVFLLINWLTGSR